MRWWQELLVVAVVALVAAALVKTFLLQPFYIPSESMEPGLVKDDRILVEKASYWFGSPQRGDVVVFADPGGWLAEPEADGAVAAVLARLGLQPTGGHLVKRVIGVAGDTVVCCDEEGHLQVNGETIIEPYARPDAAGCFGPMQPGCEWSAGPVPEGQVFVMGDNRAESADSSYWLCPPAASACEPDPYVDVDLVVGKLAAVVWPLDRLDLGGGTEVFLEVPEP
ncbi:signal peptidase I [Nocardioides sp. zg-DK7169]|nr:signal peptidase I [Nocardioides sp. zg-DK7169]NPC95549.1 signal peptidase I [Nocardioides sp. zg-DK7169]